MKRKLEVLVQFVVITLLIALTTAQHNHRNEGKKPSYRSQQNDEPKEQGRTLGLIRPLLGTIARPFLGYDVPYVSGGGNRPSSGTSSSQSDPYYGYGSYGGYSPNYYNSYNYYGGGYPFYRPVFPYYNPYRPLFYPGFYGGNAYGGQRPIYSNSRPRPVAQRPLAGQQAVAYPTASPTLPSTGSPAASTGNNAQAVQIANLLGQLLGQQLRPLLNQGAASPAHDEPIIAPSSFQDKSFRNRYYRG